MLESVQLAVCPDFGGALLPLQPIQRILRYQAESMNRPGRRVLGQVLTYALLPGVHGGRQLSEEALPLRVGDLRDAGGPRTLRLRDERACDLPDPRVDNAGQVPGPGEGPEAHGIPDDIADVKAGCLDRAQCPPQPRCLR